MNSSIDQNGALLRGLRFVRTHLVLIIALSALLVVPSIWHRHIESGDLPSHIYNAWLAHLIEQGKAPGLYIVWQWNNILFDLLLLNFAKIFGFVIGPAIVVSICALVFFWGVFSFVAALSGRPPWQLTPCIAMLTYGYTFNMGFFNYYLSIGLACFGLALLWKPRSWDWFAAGSLFILVVLAHPIGALWFVAILAYTFAKRRLGGKWTFVVPAIAAGIFVAAHWSLVYLASVSTFEVFWRNKPFYLFNGADQLIVYSSRYRFIAGVLVATVVIWLIYEGVYGRDYPHSRRTVFFLCVELYLISFFATTLLPQGLRGGIYACGIGFIVHRLTLICAIFGLCTIGCLTPRKWASVGMAAYTAVFFACLYYDTGAINRLESHAEALTSILPFGTRVVPFVMPRPDSRISTLIGHVVDRACVGHCFTYGNYEPSSGLFRVRVRPGSPVVAFLAIDSQEMAAGTYVVKNTDPPLKEIYQCVRGDPEALCVRDLAVGETTGRTEAPSKRGIQ